MSILSGQTIDRDTLNRAYVSKTATGTQIMAGSLRLLGGITIDGATTLGALTLSGALNAGANSITTTGTITAGTFSGSGASLTSLNGTNISSGTVADARLSSNVNLLNATQTISGMKTFNTETKFHRGTYTDPDNGVSNAIKWAQGAAGDTLKLTGTLNVGGIVTLDGNDYIEFSQAGVAAPSDSSAGTKIKLFNDNKYSIGIDTATIWYDAYTNHKFFTNGGTTTRTERFRVDTSGAQVTGNATITGNLDVQGEFKASTYNEFPDPLIINKDVSLWTSNKAGTATVAFDIQAPPGIGAAGSIKVTATGADAWTYYDVDFEPVANEWVTFSVYAFATTTNVSAQLFICGWDSGGTMVLAPATTVTLGTGWARYSATVQMPATVTRFRVRVDNDGGTGTVAYFSGFQLERGRAMTGFKPYAGGKIASFFKKGIFLGSDKEIYSGYNNDYILKDHGNGAVTLSAAGGNLHLGYQNTTQVRLTKPLYDGGGSNVIVDASNKLYYQGVDIDTIYFKNTGGTLTGDVVISKNNAWLTLDSASSGADGVEQSAGISIGESGYKGSATLHMTYTGDGYGHIGMGPVSATTSLPQYEAIRLYYQDNTVRFFAAPTVNGSTVWHAGNDGAGSGLDADVLDGMGPSTGNTANTIVYRDASGNFSAGTITASLNGTATNISNTGTVTLATATESNSITITAPSYATDKPTKLLNFNWYSDAWSIGNIRSGSTPSAGLGIFLNSVEKFRFIDGTLKIGTNAVWHQGNDGAGSGLDADTLDTKQATAFMSSTVYREKVIVPVGGWAAGTSITIPNSRVYVTGSNRLQVFRDGWLQELTDDYVEASTSTVSFTYDLPEDTKITFIITSTG